MKYETAVAQRREAIRKNHAAFKKLVVKLGEEYAGKYVLLRDAAIVGCYESAADAVRAGVTMYPNDVRYSVERVQEEPIYMGMYAPAYDRHFIGG